jgi:glycyl-tRNA synthetase beta chain
MSAPLLLEIGCEEIPAGMIQGGARELAQRVTAILEQSGLRHGPSSAWGGSRRLTVRVEDVETRQADREEWVLGPPARAAFGGGGEPTAAAVGFAKKQGIDASALVRRETDKGEYAAFRRHVGGKSLGEILGAALPQAMEGMSFPKTMRWGDGVRRWVRPVHWLLVQHGGEVLPVEAFGVRASAESRGHRFLAPGPVPVAHPDRYREALAAAFVVADPGERRSILARALEEEAAALGGELVRDEELLEEAVNLVEWPGVVAGRFEPAYLELPREILVTTLRHHQKAFSVQAGGRLLPAFLSVANTDRDPAGHVARGNEWVVGGRLEDARYFWAEDRKRPLASRVADLAGAIFHKTAGSYLDKVRRTRRVAEDLAGRLGLAAPEIETAGRAAELSKADLTTGLVGEFPELQGIVGGLLLLEEGEDRAVADAVYEHYRPAGAEDSLPGTAAGGVVSVADKLDALASLLAAGETATGSRDPFALRRAASAIYRVALDRGWALSLDALAATSAHSTGGAPDDRVLAYLEQRFHDFLRDRGFTSNEVLSVLRAGGPRASAAWPLHDIVARLEAIEAVRGRADFEHLVDLTKRVDNILGKGAAEIGEAVSRATGLEGYREEQPAARLLESLIEELEPAMLRDSERKRYAAIVDHISRFIRPVERFFDEVLVIDPQHPEATHHRCALVARLRALLVSYFDIRELAGQADRRS